MGVTMDETPCYDVSLQQTHRGHYMPEVVRDRLHNYKPSTWCPGYPPLPPVRVKGYRMSNSGSVVYINPDPHLHRTDPSYDGRKMVNGDTWHFGNGDYLVWHNEGWVN